MNPNANSSQPNLPEEMWSEVFSHLSVRDLKSVRLTCHLFYEASHAPDIQKNEVFVLGRYGMDAETIKSMMNIKREVWNIRLVGVELSEEHILRFFQKIGAHIRSLTLYECPCQPKSKSVAMIIELCRSMRSFAIHSSSYCKETVNRIYDSFEILQENKVILENVTSLTLQDTSSSRFWGPNLYKSFLTNGKFFSIFAVFSNIQQLEISVRASKLRFDRFTTDPTCMTSNGELTFTSIYRQLFNMRDQLEQLKLHLWYDANEEYPSMESVSEITQIEMKNLRFLSSNWMNRCDISISNPVSRFKHLTEIECIFIDTLSVSESTFIQLLLDTLQELRSLKFTVPDGFRMDEECFKTLVRSDLTTLIIHAIRTTEFDEYEDEILDRAIHLKNSRITADFEQFSLKESLLPNYTLKNVRMYLASYGLLFLFSKYFRCLQNFLVTEVGPDILHNLLHYQTNLRCLKLYNCDSYGWNLGSLQAWSKIRDPLSANQFDHLTDLNIVEDRVSFNLSTFLLDKLAFPRLKSLIIRSTEKPTKRSRLDHEPLLQLLPKLTQLKHLEIYEPYLNLTDDPRCSRYH